jgi:hypothetical protein
MSVCKYSRHGDQGCGSESGSEFFFEAGIRIPIKVKIQKLERLQIEPWRAVDIQNGDLRLKMKPWGVYRPVVADNHHFEEELDPDPDQH